MTVKHLGNQIYAGLSSDTKPTLVSTIAVATFIETDTRKRYFYDSTTSSWMLPELQSTKKYKVIKPGTTTHIVNQFGQVEASNSDTQVAIQAIIDAMTSQSVAEFTFDKGAWTMNNPITLPTADFSTLKQVRFIGSGISGNLSLGTIFVASGSFPTNRYFIEATCANGSGLTTWFYGRDLQFSNQNNIGSINVGAMKFDVDLANVPRCIGVENCWMRYMWRSLHLLGGVWFCRFVNLHFQDNPSFVGDTDIILEYGGHTLAAGNAWPKVNYFENLTGNRQGIMNYALIIQDGGYNTFNTWFQDGATYTLAPFALRPITGGVVHDNAFYNLTYLDAITPSPDSRLGAALYISGTTVYDNHFYQFRTPNYPNAVYFAFGALRNSVELVSYFGATAIVKDTGAGEGNVVTLLPGAKTSAGDSVITTTNGIARVIDKRGGTFSVGTATITSAATSVTVTHNLIGTPPSSGNIQVTPTNSMGSSAKFWISNITSTTFKINVDIAPGATTATFAWSANLDS
jgi:hypothetical protein